MPALETPVSPIQRRSLLGLAAGALLASCGGGSGSMNGGSGPAPAPSTGNITLLAGSLRRPGSADGEAAQASFLEPWSVAQDASGVLYVADTGNHTVRRVAADGLVTTLAGMPGEAGHADGVGAGARLSAPAALAVTPQGDVFVADTGNHVIRRITPAGEVSTLAGAPGSDGAIDGAGAAARFRSPRAIAIDARGDLLVVDRSPAVRRVTPGGVVSTFLGHLAETGSEVADGTMARFLAVTAVAVDPEGGVVVAESEGSALAAGGRLRRFDADGRALPWGMAPQGMVAVPFPESIAALSDGSVAVASVGSAGTPSFSIIGNEILRVDATGRVRFVAGQGGYLGFGSNDGPGTAARFLSPRGVGAGAGGAILVADTGNHAVRRITPSGQVETLAGGSSIGRVDARGDEARFHDPVAIAAAPGGHLVVADRGNARVRRISPTGTVSTVSGSRIGSGTPPVNEFGRGVTAVAVGPDGAIYVASIVTPTISVIETISVSGTLTGLETIPTPLAPTSMAVGADGRLYFTSSGGDIGVRRLDGSTQALPGGGTSIAVDAAGNVYVVGFDHTVRLVAPNGSVRVLAGIASEAGYVDGRGTQARFTWPRAITPGAAGTLFVADASTIRRITSTGNVSTVAGTPNAALPQPGPLPGAIGTVKAMAWSDGMLHAVVGDAVLAIGPVY